MFRNILVPTDGSALSRKAVKKAVTLAKKTGARVTGFHVAPAYKFNVYADYIPPDFILPRDFETRTKKVAEQHLEVVKKECGAVGVRCTTWFGRIFQRPRPIRPLHGFEGPRRCRFVCH